MERLLSFVLYLVIALPIGLGIDHLTPIEFQQGEWGFALFILKCVFIYLPLLVYVSDPLATKIYNKYKKNND